MGYSPPIPDSSRLIDYGHSWVAPSTYPYSGTNIGMGVLPSDGEQWPNALKDALGIGSSGGTYTKTYIVPARAAGAATVFQLLDNMPSSGTIEGVWYIPAATQAGAATNTRGVGLYVGNWFAGTSPFSEYIFYGGSTLTSNQPFSIFNINSAQSTNGNTSGTVSAITGSPYFESLRYNNNGASPIPQELYWKSTLIGTGGSFADPGGVVVIRYGTRYRNFGVAASNLLKYSVFTGRFGSWWTPFSYAPISRPGAPEVNVTSAGAALNATSVPCSPLEFAVVSGSVVYFAGGVTATLTAAGLFGATSLTVSALPAAIPGNSQGHCPQTSIGFNGSYDSLSPSGINVWTHGVNDADDTNQDVNAWTETSRSVIARNMCSAWYNPYLGNWATVNGGGTWAAVSPPTSGVLPFQPDAYNGSGTAMSMWTGTVSGSPKVTISIGPAFEGGIVDLFVLGAAGTSLGVAGAITVDGTTPPQGTVTVNTSAVSTSALLVKTVTGTITAAASATVTGSGTNFAASDVGCLLIPASGTYPAGLIITAVASATSITVSSAITVTAVACTTNSWTPMVKRITGLSSGAHTVTLTITGSDSVANSVLMVYGLGIETLNPPTPVLWCNIPRCPSQNSTQKSNSVALNTASAAMIAGTATPLTGNTAEPALGNNVQLVDIDSLFGGASPIVSYFMADGLHPNSKGHRLMARTLFSVMQSRFTPDQLISR